MYVPGTLLGACRILVMFNQVDLVLTSELCIVQSHYIYYWHVPGEYVRQLDCLHQATTTQCMINLLQII